MKGSILILLLVLFASYAVHFLYTGLPVITGFVSKVVCSGHYISHREVQDCFYDTINPFAKLVTLEDLKETKSIRACIDIYGIKFSCQESYYTQGIGCTRGSRPHFDTKLVEKLKKQRKEGHWPHGDIPHASHLNENLQSYLKSIIDANVYGNSTRQIVVVHKGVIVGEAYDSKFPPHMPLLGWSMTKSITNGLVGVMVQKGLINLDDKVYPHRDSKITVDNLLRMNSGVKFEEVYTRASDVTRMLYTVDGMVEYFDTLPFEKEPGEHWVYSSGTTNKLSHLIKEKVGGTLNDYYQFVRNEFFDKIGMTSAIIEPDGMGTFVGSSYMFATARDWARFGLLLVNNGIWGEERILPENWVNYSSTITNHSDGQYGAHFYLKISDTFPDGTFFCLGYSGQIMVISPAHELVIMKLSCKDPADRSDVYQNHLYSSIKSILKLK